MTVPHCFPAAGTVRTTDERITLFYRKAEQYRQQACLWEGLFRLACLTCSKPADEPVAILIREALSDSEDGAFSGSFAEQLNIARAALALFEYSTDRTILRRIAEWLRYVEIEYDRLISPDSVLFNPADLMELLVRYYQATGLKSVLRLCVKIRTDSFDWVTALHTFQQTIPIRAEGREDEYTFPACKPGKMDFTEKEKLINHAGLLADGVRYSLYAGIFSGHGQDLTAGKTVWKQLIRHHRALCGGTTGDPFLSGNAPNSPVNNSVLAAWTEAFGSQMILSDFTWAADEMIRLIRNGLDECLNREEIRRTQYINTIRPQGDALSDPVPLYARLTRAVAAAYRYSVALTDNGVRVNYLMPARYLLMGRKQSMILRSDYASVLFQCKKPVLSKVEIYISPYCSGSVQTPGSGRNTDDGTVQKQRDGYCVGTDREWHDGDRILFVPDRRIICEDTHHKGAAFISSGRLLCMHANKDNYARAICGLPEADGDCVSVPTVSAEQWKLRNGMAADIPVLPQRRDEPVLTELTEYALCPCRITMFPRAR